MGEEFNGSEYFVIMIFRLRQYLWVSSIFVLTEYHELEKPDLLVSETYIEHINELHVFVCNVGTLRGLNVDPYLPYTASASAYDSITKFASIEWVCVCAYGKPNRPKKDWVFTKCKQKSFRYDYDIFKHKQMDSNGMPSVYL